MFLQLFNVCGENVTIGIIKLLMFHWTN